MPFPFQVILVAGATGYLITGLLFLVARSMPRTNPGAGCWALSSLAAGLGYIALLVLGMQGRPDLGEALYNTLFVFWVTALYIGLHRFLHRPLKLGRLLGTAAVVVAWLGYFYFLEPAFLPAAIVVALYCGLLNLQMARLVLRKLRHHGGFATALGFALGISGLHWLDYPLLRPVEAFAPIGFTLCAVLAVAINSLLAGLVLLQFRQRMSETASASMDAARRDPLTGLNNRMALDLLFEQAAATAHREGHEMAMLFIDLDNFKPINDRFGHKAGDQVLVDVAERLRAATRQSDIVVRLGGDEFVVILTRLMTGNEAAIDGFASKLLESLGEPMEVEGEACSLSASVGVARFPAHGEALDALLKHADHAMYHCKRNGKNSYSLALAEA